MGFWSSIGKGLKNIGKTVVNSFSSTSGLVTGGLGNDYLDKLGNTVAGGLSDAWGSYTGETIAKKNLEAQEKQWALQNDLNERQFAYQQKLNQQQQEREDNAMQRKVTDLKNAGLNPVLAAGGSGSPSAPLSAPAQKTAPAPYLDDYSKGGREALFQISSAVFQALSMKKDFAMKDAEISLLRANKEKVDAEAAGIRKENDYKDEFLAGRNKAQNLANAYAEGTLDNRVKLISQEVTLNDKEIVLKEIDKKWKELDITSKELDNAYARLRNYYFSSEKELELTAKCLAIMTSWSEYQAKEFAREFYNEEFNVPVGFDPSNSYLAAIFVGRNGDKVLNLLDKLVPDMPEDKSFKYTRSEWKKAVKEATSYPKSGNYLWNKRMVKEGDYGVRRNH